MNESVMALKRNLISFSSWADKLAHASLSSVEEVQIQNELEHLRDNELRTAVHAVGRLMERFEYRENTR